jgi:hypothetical protein
MGLRFPPGSNVSILTPKPPVPRLLVATMVAAAAIIGATTMYGEFTPDSPFNAPTTVNADAPARVAGTAPSAVVSSAFQNLTVAIASPPLSRPQPVTDGYARPAGHVAEAEEAESVALATEPAADELIPLPKSRPAPVLAKPTRVARSSSPVTVYTLPDGQQVSVRRPSRSNDPYAAQWNGWGGGGERVARRGAFDYSFW